MTRGLSVHDKIITDYINFSCFIIVISQNINLAIFVFCESEIIKLHKL